MNENLKYINVQKLDTGAQWTHLAWFNFQKNNFNPLLYEMEKVIFQQSIHIFQVMARGELV